MFGDGRECSILDTGLRNWTHSFALALLSLWLAGVWGIEIVGLNVPLN